MVKEYIIVRDNLPKCVVSVSKKHNSVWRVYYYDIDDTDNTWKFYTEKINPLLVWYYKLKKQKVYNNICDSCGNVYLFLTNWYDKKMECDSCLNEY